MEGGEYRSRSSLTKFAAQMRDPDPAQAHKVKKEAWHKYGIIMIDPEEDLQWDGAFAEREMLKALAIRLYGKRRTDLGGK